MPRFTAIVEEAQDSTWTAAVLGEHIVLGTGQTKDAALLDLRNGLAGLQHYLESKGQTLPEPRVQVVEVDLAA